MKEKSLQPSTDRASEGRLADEADQILLRWNTELFSLYNKRMREYCMLPFSLMTCASPDDVADMQTAFLETLRTDYRSSAERLGQMLEGESAPAASGQAYSEALLKAQADARAILDQAKAQAKRIVAEAEARVRPEANSGKGSTAAAA